MSKFRPQPLSRIRTCVVRALTFVLMAGIVYSTTFGAVHSHLNTLTGQDAGISARSTSQAAVSTTTLHKTSDVNECLTCVLHRQFSSTTVHTPVFVLGPEAEIAFTSTPAVFYNSDPTYSRPLTQRSGRAPPLRLV